MKKDQGYVVVFIPGYGCDADDPLLLRYIRHIRIFVVSYLKCNSFRRMVIVCSGGPTNPERFPYLTEARVSYELLACELLPWSAAQNWEIEYHLEEHAQTTADNFFFGAVAINRLIDWKFEGELPREIFVWGDLVRKLKIKFYTWRYLTGLFVGRNRISCPVEFKGVDFFRTEPEKLRQILQLPLEILTGFVPALRAHEHAAKCRSRGIVEDATAGSA